MSIPQELRDQLLSGYLDDALSADERSRVEQLLQTDASLAGELAELRNLRQSLRVISNVDSDIKLDSGFADRVLGAAVARAHAEGYGDDHPLVRLSEHPSTSAKGAGPGSPSWRYAGLLVGLAASIAIAVLALRPDVLQDAGGPDPGLALLPEAEPRPQEPLLLPELGPASESVMIADAGESSGVAPNPGEAEIELRPDPLLAEPIQSPPEPREAIASAERMNPPKTVETPVSPKIELPGAMQGAILVFDVRQTEAGRRSDAVADAMAFASLGATSEREITEEIVGLVQEAQPATDGKASVLYLHAPAKSLDRFYLRLLSDQEGIESVGMSIALDAPIMNMVNKLHSNPTVVQHDPSSLELMSDNGVVDQFANRLGQLQYMPLDRTAVSAIPSNGPDEMAQILVLVR